MRRRAMVTTIYPPLPTRELRADSPNTLATLEQYRRVAIMRYVVSLQVGRSRAVRKRGGGGRYVGRHINQINRNGCSDVRMQIDLTTQSGQINGVRQMLTKRDLLRSTAVIAAGAALRGQAA